MSVDQILNNQGRLMYPGDVGDDYDTPASVDTWTLEDFDDLLPKVIQET